MGKSRTLDSISHGNWIEDNKFTEEHTNNFDIELYESIIKDYSRKIDAYKEETKQNNVMNVSVDSVLDLSQPVLKFPKYNPSYNITNGRKYYRRVQNWQGIVIEVKEDSFTARLNDLLAGGTDEIAEFYLEEVSPGDNTLVVEGALFYWSVGHFMENGQSVNRSDLRFQRLVSLDEDDIEYAANNVGLKYSNLKERKIDNSSSK